ncbi:hypothetical protein HAP94_23280 [Acidithiobacillus ferrivorans]|nr:hypothetical protein [Acidithiobacillus ferrivorans]
MNRNKVVLKRLEARLRANIPARPKVRRPSGKLRGLPNRVFPDLGMPERMDYAVQIVSTRDGMSGWDKEKRKAVALARMRRSGLFEMDIESWIRFFDENPDQITTGFVNFVISQRKSELRYWL